MQDKQYIRATKAAERLEVDPKTILNWIANGRITDHYKLNPASKNSPIMIAASEVDRIIRERMIAHYSPKDK